VGWGSSSPHCQGDRVEVIIIAPCGVRLSLRCLDGLSWPGVELIDENRGRPGVRLRRRVSKEG
jgi:hypothetical protein